MNHTTSGSAAGSGILASLRALHPTRRLTMGEALRIAELQAGRLLALTSTRDVPVPTIEILDALPRICVEYDQQMPGVASGSSDWDTTRRCWVISLNPAEPDTRIRLTAGHEFKHILDHGKPLLQETSAATYDRPAEEYLADYFAGCLLMPKTALTRAWYDGIQRPRDLAALFDVSLQAMLTRLRQLALLDRPAQAAPREQAGRSATRSTRRGYPYYRALSPTHETLEVSV